MSSFALKGGEKVGIVEKFKNLFNMGDSKRRFRLGVGISDWGSAAWYLSNVLCYLL